MRLAGVIWEPVRQTAANIWRHKLRSFLTMFGIAWGIASLVLMNALCDGFKLGQRRNMSQLGDSLVLVWNGRTEKQAGGQRAGQRVFWEEADVEAIREQCPAVAEVAAEVKRTVNATSEFNSGRFLALGVTEEYLRLRNLPAAVGRTITAADQLESRRVCVLGDSVRKQLFENRPDVLGRVVNLEGYPYVVIGMMSEKNQNSSYDGWDNEKILVPQSSLVRDFPPPNPDYRKGRVNPIVYRPVSVERWQEAARQVRAVLARRHGFDPTDEGATPSWDMVESAERFDRAFRATEVFLALVALVTLSLGGVGVMNTMMSAVAERTHEIGLRKALGATSRRILGDFLLEGVLLALASGALGLAAVSALAAGVNSLPMPDMFAGLPVRMEDALVALAALGAVAVFSAIPPALRACRLTPVEALREER
jgi:putative ABC transport system permease protein